MSSEEIEEYWELLWQLELTSKEGRDDSFENTSQSVQYFWCDKWFAMVLVFFTVLMHFEKGFFKGMYFFCSKDVKCILLIVILLWIVSVYFFYDTTGFILFMYVKLSYSLFSFI